MPELQSVGKTSVDHLRLVIEAGKIGIWELDLDTGQAWRNARHDEIFGYSSPLPEWTYDQFLAHIAIEDRARVDRLQRTAIENKEEWLFDCRIKRPDGLECWVSAAGRPILGEKGEVSKLIGHVIDITETKRNEARLRILTDELNHRVRNMLATIKAMVRLSSRNSPDISTFAEALEGRVSALARTHDLLVGDFKGSLTPHEIFYRELGAYSDFADRTTITEEGQPLLSAVNAQGLSLVAHELITNAIKYGAFSNDCGTVEVRISQDGENIIITWKERGGPPVQPPNGEGFGTRMIAGALGTEGSVKLDYNPEGLACRIELKQG